MIFDANKIEIVTCPVVIGLPRGAEVEYYGKLPDGRTFVIARPAVDWDYNSFYCVIDKQSCRIDRVTRYRDGGTTVVETEIGTFNFPTPFKPQLEPNFDGLPIEVYGKNQSTRALM